MTTSATNVIRTELVIEPVNPITRNRTGTRKKPDEKPIDQKLHKIFKFKRKTNIHVHIYESKSFIHKYAKVLIHMASKSDVTKIALTTTHL